MTPEQEALLETVNSKLDRVLNHLNGKESSNPDDVRSIRDPIGEIHKAVGAVKVVKKP